MLDEVKDSISFESFMDLRNAKVSSGSELLPVDVLEKAVEKSLKVLHDEAIRKTVSLDIPQKGKKLHFFQQQQSKWSYGSSTSLSFRSSSLASSSSKASSSSSC